MQLFMVGASPYARKVRAAAGVLGLGERIEVVIANPHLRPPVLTAKNPLSKVPTLVTDDGEVIFDSFVICEYLDAVAGGARLLPPSGSERRAVMKRYSLAHGVMDCAVIRRLEGLRRQDDDRDEWVSRQVKTIDRVLDAFEADQCLEGAETLDRITLAAALGFLDFRFQDRWREGRPRLAAWFEEVDRRPWMTSTRPFD